jgi:type II secretory pathway pseudopilin PulG
MSLPFLPAIFKSKQHPDVLARAQMSAPATAQYGNALLLVFLTLGLGSTLFLQAWNNRIDQAQEERTEGALRQAREALIAFALAHGELQRTNAHPPGKTTDDDITLPPGTLPCPETGLNITGEGSQNSSCNRRDLAAIGRLPWRSLGSGPLRDGHGECLWYAVSGAFKANPSAHLLNWDSPGTFEIHDGQGRLIESDVIAVVFSPGPALAGQDRSPLSGTDQCGGNYTASAYLDGILLNGTRYDNAALNPDPNGKNVLIAGPVHGPSGDTLSNDRLISISRNDLFASAIEKRTDFTRHLYDPGDADGSDESKYGLAQKLAACLAYYGKNNTDPADKRLPWASRLDVADFDNDSFDDLSGQYAGRPAYRVGSSRTSTKNALVPAGCSSSPDNCRLLIIDRCLPGWWRLAGKPLDSSGSSKMQSPDGWWDKWKDQFFYVVAPEFSPNSSHDWTTHPDPCTATSRCITVGNRRYAAVVAFAGKVRPGQQRASLADRQNIANYLDDSNALAFVSPGLAQARTLTATGNDQLVCITPDLTIDSTCR